jgi:hypothetical protein
MVLNHDPAAARFAVVFADRSIRELIALDNRAVPAGRTGNVGVDVDRTCGAIFKLTKEL